MNGWEIYQFCFVNFQRILTLSSLLTLSILFFQTSSQPNMPLIFGNDAVEISFIGLTLIIICFGLEAYRHSHKKENKTGLDLFDDKFETIISFSSMIGSSVVFLTIGIFLIIKTGDTVGSSTTNALGGAALSMFIFTIIVLVYNTYRTNHRTKYSHESVASDLIKKLQENNS